MVRQDQDSRRMSFWKSKRTRLCIALAFVVSLTAAACSSSGVALRSGYLDLEPCGVAEPVTVGELAFPPNTGCDLMGAEVLFPDGRTLEVPAMAASISFDQSERTDKIGIVNWGVDGVVATFESKGQLILWGTRSGIAQQQLLTVRGRGDAGE